MSAVQAPEGTHTEEKGHINMATVDVDIKQLLEAGAHFGHKTSRWHPKMAQYIHSKRGGSHIIDLTKTVDGLESALDFIAGLSAKASKYCLSATKRQAQDIVRSWPKTYQAAIRY
jgi:small subunit ribosomal protein S2